MTGKPKLELTRGTVVKADPAVSIIIPNYNTAHFICETIESVLAQTFTDIEVIVINDGSPDSRDLAMVLQPYLECIIFVNKTYNDGTSATRNQAAEIASAEKLVFLDADDIWMPSFLEDISRFLEDGRYDMAYADCSFFSETGGPHKHFPELNPEQGLITRELLINGKCHILPSGCLIRRSAFVKAGRFDASVKRTEDFDLWMRMIFSGARIGYLRKVLFAFRLSPASGSGDAVVRIERSIECWRTLQAKLEFTEGETRTIERHILADEAAALRARARDDIFACRWNDAIRSIRSAHEKAAELGLPLKHRIKLKVVLWLLRIWPSLLRSIYVRSRSEEIEYLPSRLAS